MQPVKHHLLLAISCYLELIVVSVHCIVCCMYVCVRCEWFFEWAVRALMGFCSVVWSVWCRHLSEGRANQHCGNEPISALGIEPISGWHARHGSPYISSGFWLWYSDHDSFLPSIHQVNRVFVPCCCVSVTGILDLSYLTK